MSLASITAPGAARAGSRTAAGAALMTAWLTLVAAAPFATAETRYGDSTWVAPNAPDIVSDAAAKAEIGAPPASGPRVAEPDEEPAWETVLRLPFRVAFAPLRLVARGMEAGASIVEKVMPPRRRFVTSTDERSGIRLAPAFRYSGAAGPAAGATASVARPFGAGSRMSLTGTWSLRDNRRVRFRGAAGEDVSAIGLGLDAVHDYRPNRRFYGVGNDARSSDRSIYLRRDNELEGFVFFGRDRLHQARALIGYSDIDVGPGYNGTPRAVDRFAPGSVPFLTVGSRVSWLGLSGDLAALDRDVDPSLGVHARAAGRRFEGQDDLEIDHDRWRLEGRGYLPVFASRRVVALRMAYEGVDPRGGAPLPFYRLPESSRENRFAGYSSGQFRDRRLILAHAEYRWLIWNRVWAVALAQVGQVADRPDRLRLRDAHESVGGGLRVRMSDARVARLEFAKGDDGARIYLDVAGDF